MYYCGINIYSEPMTLQALGGLAGSRRTLLHASGRHGSHLESMTSCQKSNSIDAYLLEEQSC